MNVINLAGTVFLDPIIENEYNREKFYKFFIDVPRYSGTVDRVPCVISEKLINKIKENKQIEVSGNVKSFNYHDDDGKFHLDLKVFVREVFDFTEYKNDFSGNIHICKKPFSRITSKGRRIADVMAASNRSTSYKCDYIPCIFWGRDAKKVARLDVGTGLELNGRFQSRKYIKNFDDGTSVEKTAYEISIDDFKEWKDESKNNNGV